MNPVASVAALYEQIDQAKRAGTAVTNFYPAPDKVQRWLDRGELFSQTHGDVLFVLRRDRDFVHVSYVASAAADLGAAVRALVERVPETLAVDLIGPKEPIGVLVGPKEPIGAGAQLFAQAGFRPRCTLQRMTRSGAALEALADDPELGFATSDEGPALAAMLETALDRHAEQIPDADEMAHAAAAGKVLVVRSGNAIAGLLFFEVTGYSSLLRHWLVDPAFRDQRVGARLMRRYFADCKDVRRFLLWVISDNHNAIDRYRHYGYREDGLIDQVLIRQPS